MLLAQLDQIKYVQRITSSPEVNFYTSRKGGEWKPDSLLPNRGEVRIADVAARISRRDHKGTVDAVSGHLFSLTLRPAVIDVKKAMLEAIHVRVVDPSALMDQHAALDVAPLSFVREPDEDPTVSSDTWTPCAQAEVYLVALPEADWAVLAHGPRGRLLVGRRSEAGELFSIVDVDSNEMAPIAASSFRDALREAEEGAV